MCPVEWRALFKKTYYRLNSLVNRQHPHRVPGTDEPSLANDNSSYLMLQTAVFSFSWFSYDDNIDVFMPRLTTRQTGNVNNISKQVQGTPTIATTHQSMTDNDS